jgi:hypothetical protein
MTEERKKVLADSFELRPDQPVSDNEWAIMDKVAETLTFLQRQIEHMKRENIGHAIVIQPNSHSFRIAHSLAPRSCKRASSKKRTGIK